MAITYVEAASWASAGAGTPNYNKSVTFSGAAAGDLLFVAGVAEDYDAGNPTARSVATTSGSTSAWTTPTVSPVDQACDMFGGWATVSTTGSVTVRVSLRCNNVNWMGVGGFLYPAAEWDSGTTPAFTVLNAPGTNTVTGLVSVTLGTGTWSVFYFSGDWAAVTYGATTTPAGGTNDSSQADAAHYSDGVRHWTGQASGTRNYGVSGTNRNAGELVLAVAEAGGGAPALPPIIVMPPRR